MSTAPNTGGPMAAFATYLPTYLFMPFNCKFHCKSLVFIIGNVFFLYYQLSENAKFQSVCGTGRFLKISPSISVWEVGLDVRKPTVLSWKKHFNYSQRSWREIVKKRYSKWCEVPGAQPRTVTVLLLKRGTKCHCAGGRGRAVTRGRGRMAEIAFSPGNSQLCFHVPVRWELWQEGDKTCNFSSWNHSMHHLLQEGSHGGLGEKLPEKCQ